MEGIVRGLRRQHRLARHPLQGRFSKGVMERVCLPGTGLFPTPKEIKLSCSCPDWADMCKHVAAVLYGVGARLDASPELLFILRGVDHAELVAKAGEGLPVAKRPISCKRVMAGGDLGALFRVEMAETGGSTDASPKAHAKKGQGKGQALAKRRKKRKRLWLCLRRIATRGLSQPSLSRPTPPGRLARCCRPAPFEERRPMPRAR